MPVYRCHRVRLHHGPERYSGGGHVGIDDATTTPRRGQRTLQKLGRLRPPYVGTVAEGRIGSAVMRRLAPFGVHLHYFDKKRLPAAVETVLAATYPPGAAPRRANHQRALTPGAAQAVNDTATG